MTISERSQFWVGVIAMVLGALVLFATVLGVELPLSILAVGVLLLAGGTVLVGLGSGLLRQSEDVDV